jgi:hypothetical protein
VCDPETLKEHLLARMTSIRPAPTAG